MVRTLLLSWAKYMRSDEYEKERVRAQKVDPDDDAALSEKERQEALTLKVHRLRHQIRQMKALHATARHVEWTWQERERYEQWLSGETERELERLTHQHGYGILPVSKINLLPRRFPDTVP